MSEKRKLMCRAVTCRVCGKTTWAGCGEHIETVRRTVPATQWCNGKHSPAETASAQSPSAGIFARLFRR